MKRHLATLAKGRSQMWACHIVVGKVLKFPKHLVAPAIQHRAVTVSTVSPLLPAYLRNASSRKSAEGTASLEKGVWLSFSFP